MASHNRSVDRAHHHPRVQQSHAGEWEWSCPCGGHSTRAVHQRPWRLALIGSLIHATHLAP